MKKLNKDVIKYIAIVLMAIDHIIQGLPVVDGYAYDLLDGLSHFTYVTMAFFLIESFKYTHSKKNYINIMLIFALISQIPFSLAFSGKIDWFTLNIMYTLAFNFILICLFDKTNKMILKIIYGVIAIVIGFFCDWIFLAPIIVMLFWWARENKIKQWISYGLSLVLVVSMTAVEFVYFNSKPFTVFNVFAAGWGIVLSAICTLCLYNGKKMNSMKKFNKWFFYIFYPAHLLIIGIIKITCF